MKRILGATGAMVALVGMAFAQATVTETININRSSARQVVAAWKENPGHSLSVTVTANERDNTITLSGSPDALARAKADLLALDVAPIVFRLQMRLVKVQSSARGPRTETVLQAPIIMTVNDQIAKISVTSSDPGAVAGGWSVEVLPHRDPRDTVLLTVKLREEGNAVRFVNATRRIALGQSVRFTGVTDSTDREIRKQVLQGQTPSKGAFVAYFVDVTAMLEPGN